MSFKSRTESRSNLVVELAEEFLDRYRNGERPTLKEYTDRYPQLADEIREVFPALAMLEKIALDEGPRAPGASPGTSPHEGPNAGRQAARRLPDLARDRSRRHGGRV